MKVERWISYDEAEGMPECPLPPLGGFYGAAGDPDVVGTFPFEGEHAEALREEIIKRRMRLTGEQHQNDRHGVPVFSDGTVYTASFRAWGDFMAATWSVEEGKSYSYMDFYM